MQYVNLGNGGPRVSSLGLGCMGMSGMYGPADETESIATIHAAMEAGITLLDTGDFYGMGHNELLIRKAVDNGKRDKAIISVKFGAMRGPDNSWGGIDCRPAAMKNFLAYSLRRLGTDYIDIYRPARLDPDVPIEDTVGAIADMVKTGYVRHIGLSEVGVETINRAQKEHPVADLQIEYSLMSRGIEKALLPRLRELGIAVTAYGVLSRGLLSGRVPTAERDIRRLRMPRFQGDNLERNLQLVSALQDVAKQKNATTTQLAIAWVCSRGDDIVPLIGARTREQLNEALAAPALSLDADEIALLEALVPEERVAGTRYDAAQMANLDSEKN